MHPQLKLAWMVSIVLCVIASASILTLRPMIAGIEFAPDQGFNWYYWKRPDPDFWSRATSWGSYVAHQLFFWGVIAWAQANRDALRDRSKMHMINWIALGGMGVFVVLRYAQTALFYDGLGQDMPVVSSQMSVIFLLVIVLLMETPRRGLFFGTGTSWFRGVRPVLIRYHGYYFAWAVTYTYWYHPMETTWGHILGFLYTFFLLLQGAFIFTRVHTNRVWTFVLEVSVLIHGVTVAIVAGQEIWPMFAFGFLFLMVVTQMHGLGLSRLMRALIGAASIAAVIWVYSDRGWGQMNEIIRIPVIDYTLVALIGGLIWLGQKLLTRKGDAG